MLINVVDPVSNEANYTVVREIIKKIVATFSSRCVCILLNRVEIFIGKKFAYSLRLFLLENIPDVILNNARHYFLHYFEAGLTRCV